MPRPKPSRVKPEPTPPVPPKWVNAAKVCGEWTARMTNGPTRPRIHSGCVQAWSLAIQFIPLKTIGMTISVVIRYPSGSGMCRTSWKACAMIEPSRAKKMKVKLA